MLDALGRRQDPIGAYVRALQCDPTHFGALTDFAILLTGANLTAEALVLFEQTRRYHPDNPMARTNLAFVSLKAGDLLRAREQYEGNALSARGFTFPLLVRSPGFHNGHHFMRVARPADLADVLATLPGNELYVMQFVDSSDRDGMFRK